LNDNLSLISGNGASCWFPQPGIASLCWCQQLCFERSSTGDLQKQPILLPGW
jgi:hypothetical protein